MTAGMATLQTNAGARSYAAKTMIVLTDGINNQYPDPISTASSLMSNNKMVIHTVTFTPDADQYAMQTVAEIGNGKHYHANAPEELEDAFRELALDLPVVIIE
jgi:secreted protein with Ig-like and vWFA domain